MIEALLIVDEPGVVVEVSQRLGGHAFAEQLAGGVGVREEVRDFQPTAFVPHTFIVGGLPIEVHAQQPFARRERQFLRDVSSGDTARKCAMDRFEGRIALAVQDFAAEALGVERRAGRPPLSHSDSGQCLLDGTEPRDVLAHLGQAVVARRPRNRRHYRGDDLRHALPADAAGELVSLEHIDCLVAEAQEVVARGVHEPAGKFRGGQAAIDGAAQPGFRAINILVLDAATELGLALAVGVCRVRVRTQAVVANGLGRRPECLDNRQRGFIARIELGEAGAIRDHRERVAPTELFAFSVVHGPEPHEFRWRHAEGEEANGVPRDATLVEAFQPAPQVLQSIRHLLLDRQVVEVGEHPATADRDRVRAHVFAAAQNTASIGKIELPVVPVAGERFTLQRTHGERVSHVRTAVVDGVEAVFHAKDRDLFRTGAHDLAASGKLGNIAEGREFGRGDGAGHGGSSL